MSFILTDLDNTVFDFSPHFESWARRQGHTIKEGVLGVTYDFQSMFDYQIDDVKLLNEFFDCHSTMSSFAALPDTIEPMRRLHARGYEFVGITGCNSRVGLRAARRKNLASVFGFEFQDVYITGYAKPKTEVLKLFRDAVWIEDSLNHALDGAELGHRTFLIDHPYNQGEGDFTRVTNWLEIEDRLCTAS